MQNEQIYQEEIFRRRWGKRNWPRGYNHDQGVPWCSPWASRVLLNVLWVFKVGKKITSFGFWTPSLSTRTSGTLKLVWSLAFGREDAQLFRRLCLPVGVPLLGSATICKFTAAADEFTLSELDLGTACLESTQPSSLLLGWVCKGTLARCFPHFSLTITTLQFAALCPPQWLPRTQRTLQNGSGSSLTIWT